jgi:hypothetical protein
MKNLSWFTIIFIAITLESCVPENVEDPNFQPHKFPVFFFELVNEDSENFFEMNPEINFEEVTIKFWGLPGSGGEGQLVDQSISVMEVDGRKVILSGGLFKERPTYVFYGNGDIDTLTFWRSSSDIRKDYILDFFEDPVFYYSFNEDSLGYFDVVKDNLHHRNNFENPIDFDPLVRQIVKTKTSIDTEK